MAGFEQRLEQLHNGNTSFHHDDDDDSDDDDNCDDNYDSDDDDDNCDDNYDGDDDDDQTNRIKTGDFGGFLHSRIFKQRSSVQTGRRRPSRRPKPRPLEASAVTEVGMRVRLSSSGRRRSSTTPGSLSVRGSETGGRANAGFFPRHALRLLRFNHKPTSVFGVSRPP